MKSPFTEMDMCSRNGIHSRKRITLKGKNLLPDSWRKEFAPCDKCVLVSYPPATLLSSIKHKEATLQQARLSNKDEKFLRTRIPSAESKFPLSRTTLFPSRTSSCPLSDVLFGSIWLHLCKYKWLGTSFHCPHKEWKTQLKKKNTSRVKAFV